MVVDRKNTRERIAPELLTFAIRLRR